MRLEPRTVFLSAMACAAIALGIWAASLRAGIWQGHPDPHPSWMYRHGGNGAPPLPWHPGSVHRSRRVFCARPGALRLRRFEDGSAQLLCARRLLVRVNVPG